jgi:hypothetical protein
MNDPTTYDVIHLELGAAFSRRLGQFDAAAGYQSLADAVRAGQLTSRQLHTSDSRCRLFGGRTLGL